MSPSVDDLMTVIDDQTVQYRTARPKVTAEVVYRRLVQTTPETLQAIGTSLGVTGARIRERQVEGLRRLRRPKYRATVLSWAPHGTRLHDAVFECPGLYRCYLTDATPRSD